ncbi:MAG: protein CaiB [Deltaproteobacteria bacterium RBG_16_47_11]|nr:MAG: protein CaiB [Deltaproteobacteria bacterium RBG_16_47_11]
MTDSSNNTGHQPMPLEGIKIVEYGVFHAGPGAGAILGDLGADVVKIESGEGDPERTWTSLGRVDLSLSNGESLFFQISNRNKKGIYLDIEKEKGRQIFHRLVKEADVFLTNLRKSTKSKLGIDYETLRRVNPRIIHANISGYGPEGPMKDLGAFDPLGLARSGLMYVTGASEPVLIHGGVMDQSTAIAASHAILTALFVRERSGIGQEVHVSLYGTGLWLMYPNIILSNVLSVGPREISPHRYDHSPVRNLYRCKDGKWIACTHHPEEKYWPLVCKATGQTALINDPRFADRAGRKAHSAELVAIFDKVFATKTRDEWMEILLKEKLMFTHVQEIDEIRTDPQAMANDYVVDFKDRLLGDVRIPGYPVHFSANRAGTRSFAPTLGEHTDLVMHQMGYTDQEIGELKKEGVIKQGNE